MSPLAALLVLLCHAGPAETPRLAMQGLLAGSLPSEMPRLSLLAAAAAATPGVAFGWVLAGDPVQPSFGTPACAGDVCQPRVAIPGFEPRYAARGRRADLALAYLERSRAEPIATIASWMDRAGVRPDFTLSRLDTGPHPLAHAGWGRVQLFVRWRLDARNAPMSDVDTP